MRRQRVDPYRPSQRPLPTRRGSTMPKFVIERVLPGAGSLTADDVHTVVATSNEVLADMAPRAQWLHSYVTSDKVYCVYVAEDEARNPRARGPRRRSRQRRQRDHLDPRSEHRRMTRLTERQRGTARGDARRRCAALVGAARQIGPVLRQTAEEGERQRRLPCARRDGVDGRGLLPPLSAAPPRWARSRSTHGARLRSRSSPGTTVRRRGVR